MGHDLVGTLNPQFRNLPDLLHSVLSRPGSVAIFKTSEWWFPILED